MERGATRETAPNFSDTLGRTGAADLVRAAMELLLEHRPENPIDVLIDHFLSRHTGVPPVTAAYRMLRLAKGHPALDTEYVYQAYAAIAQGEGLRGRDFMQLIGMLSADFSPLASDMVLKIFNKLDHEAVTFGAFNTAVTTCITYEDFLLKAERLFMSLDAAGSGCAPKEVCESILQSLAAAASTAYQNGPVSQATPVLDPELQRVLVDGKSSGNQIRLSTFVRSASSLFLKIVLMFGKAGQQI